MLQPKSLAKALIGAVVVMAPLMACGDDVQDLANVDAGSDAPISPPIEGGTPITEGGADADSGLMTDVRIPGLTAPVHAVFDEFGFLHIAGKTDDDVFATLGYFHAANRFFFMDFLRNAVRGTLAKLLTAPGVVANDVTSRTFFSKPNGDPLPEAYVAQADPASKEYLDAYTRGVNAWIGDVNANRNGASKTEEYSYLFVNKEPLRPWEDADTMAVALYSLNDLSNNASSEITLGQAAQTALGLAATRPTVAKTIQDLFLDFRPTFNAFPLVAANVAPQNLAGPHGPVGGGAPAALFGQAYDPSIQKLLANASARLSTLPGALSTKSTGEHGSNNWVISGTRATNGRPLLANDPHLSLSNPSIWFPAELDSKSNGGTGHFHVAGGTFPGIPTVQTGHNENIAWGVTVTYWDMSDVYLEHLTPDNGSVIFNGVNVPLVTKTLPFIDQGTMTVMKTLQWVPHHGPIVSIDTTAHTAVSIRWVGHGGSTDITGFFGIDQAGSIAEAKAALANITTANQNFVVADKAGKIGYFPYAKVPTRPWAASAPGSSPFFPLSGDGSREWGPPVALTDIPQIEDPPAGFIATANTDINGATQNGDPLTPPPNNAPIQTVSRAEGTRLERILESITANGAGNTIETMRLLQGDTKSLLAQTMVPRFIAAATSEAATVDATTQVVVDALTAWQTAGAYTCPSGLDGILPTDPKTADAAAAIESAGCTAFHVTLYALIDAAFSDELNDPMVKLGGVSTNNSIPLLMRALRNPVANPALETFWQDITTTDHITTRDEIIRRALTKAGTVLTPALGASASAWQWGKIHTLTLTSPLAVATPMFNSDKYATPGGLYTVNVANPSSVNLNGANKSNFSHTSGASIRTLIEVGTDTPHMKVCLPGGRDLHRMSKFYNNMVPRWIANTPIDFAFGAGAVKTPSADIVVQAP